MLYKTAFVVYNILNRKLFKQKKTSDTDYKEKKKKR